MPQTDFDQDLFVIARTKQVRTFLERNSGTGKYSLSLSLACAAFVILAPLAAVTVFWIPPEIQTHVSAIPRAVDDTLAYVADMLHASTAAILSGTEHVVGSISLNSVVHDSFQPITSFWTRTAEWFAQATNTKQEYVRIVEQSSQTTRAATTQAPASLQTSAAPAVTQGHVLGAATTTVDSPAPFVVTTHTPPPSIDNSIGSSLTLSGYVTQAELAAQVATLRNQFGSITYGPSYPAQPPTYSSSGIWGAIAQSQRIDQLSGVALSNISISGVSGLTDADIPDAITASNYLSLAGGTLSGNLTLTGNLTVSGAQTLSGAITIPYLTATSTTATSTFAGGIQALRVQVGTLEATSTTATSTIAGGLNITGGGLTISTISGFLKATAGAIANSLISLTADVSGILPIANGGTNASALSSGLLWFDGTRIAATSSQITIGSLISTTTATSTFAGALGIGTTTPSAKFAVTGTGTERLFVLADSNNNEKLTVLDNGNVGIGTTSPLGKLDIYGGYVSAAPNSDDANNGFVVGISGANGTNKPSASSAMAKLYVTGSNTAHAGSLDLRSGSSVGSTINMYAVSGTQTVKFNTDSVSYINGGNVGIGTTSPYGQLSVQGAGNTVSDYADTGNTGAMLVLRDTNGAAGNGGQILFGASSGIFAGIKGYLENGTGPAGDLIFQTRTTSGNVLERMRIAYNGNVGIGVTSPGTTYPAGAPVSPMLDVSGAIRANIGGTTSGCSVQVSNDVCLVYIANGSLNVGNIAGNAWANVNASAFTVQSDVRTKTNITSLTEASGLALIEQLNPVTFNWKSAAQGTTTQIGFIAQEIASTFPSLVTNIGTTTLTLADGSTTTITNTLGVNYSGLVVPLVKAIQELNINLESIASSSATSTPESQSFASGFFANVFPRIGEWLADAGNGIGDLFARALHAREVICINQTCVNEDQLKALLQNADATSPAAATQSVPSQPENSSPDASTTPPSLDTTASTTDTSSSTSTDTSQ